jgi:hypothetical protein
MKPMPSVKPKADEELLPSILTKPSDLPRQFIDRRTVVVGNFWILVFALGLPALCCAFFFINWVTAVILISFGFIVAYGLAALIIHDMDKTASKDNAKIMAFSAEVKEFASKAYGITLSDEDASRLAVNDSVSNALVDDPDALITLTFGEDNRSDGRLFTLDGQELHRVTV